MSTKPSDRPRPPSVDAVVNAARAVVDDERTRLAAGKAARSTAALGAEAVARIEAFGGAGPLSVINATGVIVHTNLGRAPWPAGVAASTAALASRYLLLEFDRETGRRGARVRTAEEHLIALTGAEDAFVTNNNAAAVALAVGLAGRGGVVVSRGELVEIGGGVRIPEIIRRAGAKLIEVGTTNRTRAVDFEAPLAEGRAKAVLRVHPSNFTMTGFTEAPDPAEVAGIAHRHGAIVIDDLGSGALLDTAAYGLAHEPLPGERLAAGSDIVTFSGDKLVGGPQAGLVVGRADLIARMRRDPLARAMRPDKSTLAAVALTVGLYRAGRAVEAIPVWRMIATPADELRARAEALAATTGSRAAVVELRSTVGGGSVPGETLPSFGLALGARSANAPAGGAAPRRAGSHRADRGRPRGPRPADGRTRGRRRPRRGHHPGPRPTGMTVVIGTAGHIDHGKTTLLRALTGIDADRLPEEQRRGMTIDVGYAHLAFDDGTELDFVDVPGHDKLVGNMLVGAGEIDAALLVVAADDGPRAQTLEHLALLDALGIRDGIAVVTKIDAVEDARRDDVVAAVRALLARTSLGAAPVLAASSADGTGIEAVRAALRRVSDAVAARRLGSVARPPSLAIDRVFTIKGRGTVVTGTLRGGTLDRGASLRVVPGDREVRAREIQVHGSSVDTADPGRTALNLAGADASMLSRGQVLTSDPAVVATDRLLVRLVVAVPERTRARLHLGTAAVDATVGRSGRDAIDLVDGAVAILRLAEPVAAAPGDRFVLRRPSGAHQVVGGQVIDVAPARGISRRRQTPERVAVLSAAVAAGDPAAAASARLDLHGALTDADRVRLADDVRSAAADAALAKTGAGTTLADLRTATARSIRRGITLPWEDAVRAAAAVIDGLVADGRLDRSGDRVAPPGAVPDGPDPALLAAMDRLERALAVAAPPALADAARDARCPPEGIRALEADGRIVVLEPGLAYAAETYQGLTSQALALATASPLTPAALRDATGTSRRYVMAILEDLDRRGILRRTPEGHLPGPRAAAAPIAR